MDRIQAMKVFTRVVESNSFSKAADTLQMPRASVSTLVQQLEAHFKVRLLQRTTRRVGLTSEGAAYYERCVRILADIEETESAFDNISKAPRGRLRVDMPGAVGRMLVIPRIVEFRNRFPEIELSVGMSDRPVDLIQDGVDCVIRIGTIEDSRLVARRVGVYQGVTVASPIYLSKFGTPATIDDLKNHVAVNYFWGRTGRVMDFSFEVEGKPREVRMRAGLSVNDSEAYVLTALQGAGLIQAARFLAAPYLCSGTLVEVLGEWKPFPLPVSVVYPHSRHLSPMVRVFVDWIQDVLNASQLVCEQGDSGRKPRSGSASICAGITDMPSLATAAR